MLVNLTDVFTSESEVAEREVAFLCEELQYEGISYPIAESSPVKLKLTNIGQGKALVEAEAKIAVNLQCDRCLCDVKHIFELQISREAVSPDRASRQEQEEQDGFMEGYELNVENLIINEIMTCWPMKVLCRPDCKGLCPVCGQDLNVGSCECDTFVPDPRMAAIMDVFNANKEV